MIAEREVPSGSEVSRLPGGGWCVRTPASELVVLDTGTLGVRAGFELPRGGPSAVHPDLQQVAVCGADRISLVGSAGEIRWEVAHPSWTPPGSGSCAFSADGDRLWAVVPADTDDGDEWWVLDAATGGVLARVPLGCGSVGSASVRHPGGEHIAVDLNGEYGGWIGWGRWRDGGADVVVHESPHGVLADVHPRGDRCLTTPIEADELTVRNIDDWSAEAVRAGDEVFPGGEGFDLPGGYLDGDRVMAKEFAGRTGLFTADTLELVSFVTYPRGAIEELPLPDGRGSWTTFDADTGRLQLWRRGE
ncbi:hypothetical protein SAMN02982929_06914 [Saccharopolyspora kobensis]|uniref:Uncharacterized protein n=2 Tax=Saccharopolyspora kobensis TaxID=146035 RepID=A0A1H6EJ19_9PSEU|nr:hypothetical protein SAMN02982929_06914 [Saccharopolyspora kobensis]SFF24051.1 hypothetical protein SAMN05216506_12328 [Saccharopolyspora kobensis]